MTWAEAEEIARIASTADHGCSSCIGDIVERLNRAKFGFTFKLADGQTWHEPDPYGFKEYGYTFPLVTVEATQ